ncbi:uncharacterized protein LOC126723905 [Quercus robur]|uniref:uncharacterized protein LOC126723905 n=1 Tax=Quercus robur TaxID=38942 RepID=UPI002163BC32|nr:uncharacterized protein LOC126723905 [Quercus robur]
MESENTTTTTATTTAVSSSSSTNWTIAGGSLVNSVTFESYLSNDQEEEEEEDEETTTIANSNPTTPDKSPLILRPPSPDSNPCEIKIGFTQKHEVRQVYVRSTARVYEIYYESGPQKDNEYLCTVRCGIAARDEEVLTTDIKDVTANLDGPRKGVGEEEIKNGSNLTTNEDGWVEVKAPCGPVVENKTIAVPSKADSMEWTSKQELYEATAEITDASPCTSLTLRLLSLQSKGCVYVDEVYVFADPVDDADSENQEGQIENSAGSSLMAMLVPTLLQFSKSTERTTDTREMQKFPESGSRSTDPTTFAAKIPQEGKSSITVHQDVKLQEVNGDGAGPAQLQNPPQVPVLEIKPDNPPYTHLERAMDQLVSRVARIEDLFLRFEENMLKPIGSIEARLQRVEQQLEVLNKKSENSELPSHSRICAPEFSSNESVTNSFYSSVNGCLNYIYGSFESDKKDFCSDAISIPFNDTSDSVNATLVVPSLVVTAPEFSNVDDEEENLASESVTSPLKDKPKQVVSIDDALASALAGFVSSTSIQPPSYTQTLAVKAPEFANEEDGNDDRKDSARVQCEIDTDHSVSYDKTDGAQSMKDSTSSDTSLEGERNLTRSLNDDYSEKTTEGAHNECQNYDRGEDNCQATGIDTGVSSAEPDVARTDSYQIVKENEIEEVSNEISDMSVPDNTNIANGVLPSQTENVSDTTQEGAVASLELVAATESKKSGSDILRKVLEFSYASAVDFKTPVLDVKFASQENSKTWTTLEALLTDMQKLSIEPPVIEDTGDNDSSIGEQSSLILVEDGEPSASATNGHFSLDTNYCNLMDVALITEGESLQDYRPCCCSHESFAASLI